MFHYFGITDLLIDGESIDEMTDFSRIVSDVRVSYIIDQAEYYGHSGDRVKGLVFCSTNRSTVYGYRVSYGTCPIFVTYNKSDDITRSTQYADEFESPKVFSWMTRSRLTLESPEVQIIINAEHDGIDMRLFIKKSDSEGTDFYYFGRVRPISWRQTMQLDDNGKRLPIVNFKLELEHPAQDDLYEYFGGPAAEIRAKLAI